jgi:hypothetical protein
MFEVLGEEGYSLHRELIDLHNATKRTDTESKPLVSFDIYELVPDIIYYSSSKFRVGTFFTVNDNNDDNDKSNRAERMKGENNSATSDFDVDKYETDKHEVIDKVTEENPVLMATADDIDFTAETRCKLLEKLSKDTLSEKDVFLAILNYGSNEIFQNPRDIAAYFCLHAILSFVLNREMSKNVSSISCGVDVRMDLVIEYARQCLLQCLTITNQAVSKGMTGWLEYGHSGQLGQFSELPYTILRRLAYDFARRNKWSDAECLCLAMVVRCEDHLPLHHPTTLTSMFDLAISSSMVGNQALADRILNRAAERLSRYLLDIEHSYIAHLAKIKPDSKQTGVIFKIDHGREDVFKLHAFASLFRSQLNRDMLLLMGKGNDIVLTNHCFVADSLAVLANCISAANFFVGYTSEQTDNYGLSYWKLAYQHYEHCYRGLVTTKILDDPLFSRSLYGLARCLRELDETDKALKLLSLFVSYSGNHASAITANTSENLTTSSIDNVPVEVNKTNQSLAKVPRFLPISAQLKTIGEKSRLYNLMSSALCLWLMAILSVDHKRTEEGRERAFGCLHAASISLQDSLHNASDNEEQATRAMCIRFLAMIEDEAEQISEPLYE